MHHLLALAFALSAAQAPPQPPAPSNSPVAPGTSIIRGRVIAGDTGQPMRKAQVRIASGEIRDGDCCHDRFVRDVLQPLEFQVDLNLRFCRSGKKKNTEPGKDDSKIVSAAPSGSDASDTASKHSRHRIEGFFERGNCCKSRAGSA